MEASTNNLIHWIKKYEVDDFNKASETVCALKRVRPTTVPVMSSI
jgi:hypothetical protein